MDNDYTLGSPSTILIVKGEDGISVTNPFKLGAMPFPLTSTFEGKNNHSSRFTERVRPVHPASAGDSGRSLQKNSE